MGIRLAALLSIFFSSTDSNPTDNNNSNLHFGKENVVAVQFSIMSATNGYLVVVSDVNPAIKKLVV